MSSVYKLAVNSFDQEEIDAAKDVLDSGHLTMGSQVLKFENAFKQWSVSNMRSWLIRVHRQIY